MPAFGLEAGERGRTWLRLLVALAVLIVTTVAVSDQRYVVGEAAAVEAFTSIPTWAGWPLRVVMELGRLWAALIVVAVVAWRSRHLGATPTVAVLATVLVAFRLDNVLKAIVDRPRPPAVLDGLVVREHIGGYGFPSGHTTMAFAVAAALQPLLPPRWRRVAWGLAAVVGLARMHVGVHWPLDVIGGAALGTAIASAAWLSTTAVAGRHHTPGSAGVLHRGGVEGGHLVEDEGGGLDHPEGEAGPGALA